MSAFVLRAEDGTTLAIEGATLTTSRGKGETTQRTFDSAAIAMVAFEAIAHALEASGVPTWGECSAELPGILADLGSDDDRTWIVVRNGEVVAAHIYEADPVSCDNLRGEVQGAQPWERFDPDTARPDMLGIHALRRLSAHPAAARCRRLGVETWGPYAEPLLARLCAEGLAPRLTHLWISDPWDRERAAPSMTPRAIGAVFPALRMLDIPSWSWSLWSGVPMTRLDRLTLGASSSWIARPGTGPNLPPIEEVLDGVGRDATALRQLAWRHQRWESDVLDRLTAHPLLRRLDTLDLFNVHHSFDHEAFLRLRPRIEHLSTIVLGSHLVPEKTLERYRDWPAVRFGSWNRVELGDFDTAWSEDASHELQGTHASPS
jgi:hypothetical protein